MITNEELKKIQKKIESLSLNVHIEIAKMCRDNNVVMNENNNGIFINLSYYRDSDIIDKIKKYLDYNDKQEKFLDVLEKEKNDIKKDFDVNNSVESIY
jgi:hypothetical protein